MTTIQHIKQAHKVLLIGVNQSGVQRFARWITETAVFGMPDNKKNNAFARLTVTDDNIIYLMGKESRSDSLDDEIITHLNSFILAHKVTGFIYFMNVSSKPAFEFFHKVSSAYHLDNYPYVIVATHAKTESDLTRVREQIGTDAPILPFDPDSEKSAWHVLAAFMKHCARWQHARLQRTIAATEFVMDRYNALSDAGE